MRRQPVVERFKDAVVFVGDAATGPRRELGENAANVIVGRDGNDDARHQSLKAARRAALRARCSSRLMTSPRAVWAIASST